MNATNAPVLVDLLPKTRAKEALTVLVGTLTLAVASQVVIPLWFTPVPLSLSTFAVLLLGAALGPVRALASTGLYAALGIAGLPVFAGFESGMAMPSFGYVLGYIAAAGAVGALSRKYADRRVLTTLAMATAGSALIYAFGVPWLMASTGVSFAQALALGVVPFLIGDVIKAVAAGLVLPAAWKAVGDIEP